MYIHASSQIVVHTFLVVLLALHSHSIEFCAVLHLYICDKSLYVCHVLQVLD